MLFAGVALALAAVGTYSVIAYLVRQGTRDLGVRLAFGATPAAVLRMVIRQGLGLAATGIGLGIAGRCCSDVCWKGCSTASRRATR